VLVPAALELWAAEHHQQLSEDTVAEVRAIVDALVDSPLGQRRIDQIGHDAPAHLGNLFAISRAERATTLVQVVADWAEKHPAKLTASPPAGAGPAATAPEPEIVLDSPAVTLGGDPGLPVLPVLPASDQPHAAMPPKSLLADPLQSDPIEAPAFLRSDKIDEEDGVRLYGPERPWKAILGTIAAVLVVAGLGLAGWYWFTQRDQVVENTAVEPEPTVETASAPAEPDEAVETVTAAEPTAPPEPTPVLPSYWADTSPILNSGSAEIAASTYVVSPANRAVLTGHTAAITGIIVSDDGRVLTSGADRRLVDWGADVTLANPDVLNVTSPLTVLERTVDQRVLAADAAGTVTVIDLVNTVEPVVIDVHPVAISAVTELTDGRLAVASVDGDVDIFAIDEPDTRLELPHDVEVTAFAALDDGRVATAAIDGIVRIWPTDELGDPLEISTLDAPVTALALLRSGQLAAGSVDGDIHVFDAEAGAEATATVLPGHIGAVRAFHELPGDPELLVSGGDDTTVRLWQVADTTQVRVLEGHGDIISGIDSLPNGRLVTTSGDGTGRVWDLTIAPGQSVIAPHDWNLSSIHAWDNDQFVTGGVDGKVMLASTARTSQPAPVTQHDAPVVGLDVLADGTVVSLDAASVLRLSQVSSPSTSEEFELAPGSTALALSATGSFVTGHADGTVHVNQPAETGLEETLVVSAHGSGVNDVTVLESGLIASAGQDTTVRIIDPENPDAVRVLDLHTGPVDVVVELVDGRVASAGSDGIYIFSTEELALNHVRLNGQRARTISLVSLPGDRLISTGEDGRIRLWDLTTPDAEPETLVDIPGVVNPHVIQANNGLFVAGAVRGYVVFTLS